MSWVLDTQMKTRYWFFPLLVVGIICFFVAGYFSLTNVTFLVFPLFELSFLIFTICGIFGIYKGIKKIKTRKLKPSS